MKITKDLLKDWFCCYDDDQLKAVFGRKRGFTPQEIFELKIPIKDRIWVLLHEEVIPLPVLHELCCKFAERYSKKCDEYTKARYAEAIKAKRAWLAGGITTEELIQHSTIIASINPHGYYLAERAGGGAWVLNQIRKVL